MPHGVVPALSVLPVSLASQTSQRKRLRTDQIAHAVLVMNRERLVGLAGERGRACRRFEQLPPTPGGLLVPPGSTMEQRQRPQRLYSRLDAAGSSKIHRSLERRTGRWLETGARVRPAERERFPRGSNRRRALANQIEEPCEQARKR